MKKIAPVIVTLTAIWITILIPFQIIGYGYLPPDDATRHSAKVISGKDWSQILVLRDEVKIDSQPGWDTILTLVHSLTHWDAHSLLLFSVISLCVLFLVIPIIFLTRPEAWLVSLTAIAIIGPSWFARIMLGRPFIVGIVSLLVILLTWRSLKEKKRSLALPVFLTLFIAATFWIHANLYLFGMLVVVFLIAREWRVALEIGICSAVGIFLGAALTGHPVIFLKQDIWRLLFVFKSSDSARLLVSELQPHNPDPFVTALILGMLGWRILRGKWSRAAVDNPTFILICVTFVLGVLSTRIWIDWGVPAVALWVASEFNSFFSEAGHVHSWRRIIVTAIFGTALFIMLTADVGSRWSLGRPAEYISADDPEQAPWLPGPGGIIYSANMDVFYQTFYKNPHGNWRYILGMESAFMPQEDLDTLRNIQRNNGNYKYYYPWMKKMRSADRLIIRGSPDSKPKISELEWHYVAHATWSGRLPRSAAQNFR